MNQKVIVAVLLVVIALAVTGLVVWRRQSGPPVESLLPQTPPPGFGSGAGAPAAAPGR